jgi:phage shock protein A
LISTRRRGNVDGMSIVGRLARELGSAFERVLDAAEDPGKTLDQTLRDLKDQLRQGKRELVRAVAAERRLRDAHRELAESLEKWEKRAELAVRHGDDELARRALAQRRRVADEVSHAEKSLAAQRVAALELRDELQNMERRYADFENRQGTLRVKLSQHQPGAAGFGAANAALESFSDIAERLDGVEDVVAAQQEVDSMFHKSGISEAELELRFRALEEGTGGADGGTQVAAVSDLDAELDALKHKLRVRI